MSEKRFSVRLRSECDGVVYSFFDGDKLLDVDMIVVLLNEQQATISRLEEENDDLRFALRTEQAFTRVEKDKKPFLSKEEFLKELEEDE